MKPIRLEYTAFLDLEYDLWADEHAEEIYKSVEPHEKALIAAIDGLELELPQVTRVAGPSSVKIKIGEATADELAYVRQHSGIPGLKEVGLPVRFSAEWSDVAAIIDDLGKTNRYNGGKSRSEFAVTL